MQEAHLTASELESQRLANVEKYQMLNLQVQQDCAGRLQVVSRAQPFAGI